MLCVMDVFSWLPCRGISWGSCPAPLDLNIQAHRGITTTTVSATTASAPVCKGLHSRCQGPDVVACTVAVAACSAASHWEQALSLLSGCAHGPGSRAECREWARFAGQRQACCRGIVREESSLTWSRSSRSSFLVMSGPQFRPPRVPAFSLPACRVGSPSSRAMAQVGMVPLDQGPIPIQYKKNLRRVSLRSALGHLP